LIRPSINGEEPRTLRHVLSFAEPDVLQLSGHQGVDVDRSQRLHAPNRADLHGHVLLFRDSDADGNDLFLLFRLRACAADRNEGDRCADGYLRLHGVSPGRGPSVPVSCASCATATNQSARACTSWARALSRAACAVRSSMIVPTPLR